jgi:hypothetical protein
MIEKPDPSFWTLKTEFSAHFYLKTPSKHNINLEKKQKKLTNPITPQNHPKSENQMIKAHLNGSRATFFGIFKEKTIFIELFHIIETH